MRTTAVIGGGAAGLIAAGRLAERGSRVLLIEKNPMLGKKLRITGKGRCNITNDCEIEDILAHVVHNARFLYSALYRFSNRDLVALLERYGVRTKVERGGRVFPVSDQARDVAEALRRYALQKNVTVLKKTASGLILEGGRVCGVRFSDGGSVRADSVIVATGGLSYPLTGSTGDGYRFARQAGHSIVQPRASLVGLKTREAWVRELMGLSLRNVGIRLLDSSGRLCYEDFGEMLFTHFGVSGPIVLSASAHVELGGRGVQRGGARAAGRAQARAAQDEGSACLDGAAPAASVRKGKPQKRSIQAADTGTCAANDSNRCEQRGGDGAGQFDYTLLIDLKPALDHRQLDARVQRDFLEAANRQFRHALDRLLPKRLIGVVVALSGIKPDQVVNQISREQRQSLVQLLKALPVTVRGKCTIDEAIVTAGGVCVREVDPSTMQSRLAEGLYFAGEVLDVDAYTGGYNLQIAFSTGYLAGSHA